MVVWMSMMLRVDLVLGRTLTYGWVYGVGVRLEYGRLLVPRG